MYKTWMLEVETLHLQIVLHTLQDPSKLLSMLKMREIENKYPQVLLFFKMISNSYIVTVKTQKMHKYL